MRLTVSDVVSPSYFVATAAVELGFFEDEGLDVEVVFPSAEPSQDLREDRIDFLGCSPYVGLEAFPNWQGGKVLCALSQYTYWFLAVRADLNARKGDVNTVKGLRLSAAGRPGMALRHVLVTSGIDLERDRVQIVPPPPSRPEDGKGNLARSGAHAIEDGLADGYWGNAMRAEYGLRHGLASVLLDIRRGDGPPAARDFTFAALVASERLVAEQPEAAAGAVRAIVRAQRELREDPARATEASRRLFPAEEAGLIAELIARDAAFFDATVSEEMVAKTSQFARDVGALSGEVAYDQVVATGLRPLWRE